MSKDNNDKRELEIIAFETARNEAWDKYTKARPDETFDRKDMRFFEAGFRMAYVADKREKLVQEIKSEKYESEGCMVVDYYSLLEIINKEMK